MKNIKTEKEYLNQYLSDWGRSLQHVFTTDDAMKAFLKFKASKFNLEKYKKSIK